MGIGIGGHATLVAEDCRGAQYAYGSYNLNREHDSLMDDGTIYIEMASIVMARKAIESKTNSGCIRTPKETAENIDYDALFKNGLISVENCTNCWETTPTGVDTVAMHLIFKMAYLIQRDGEYPAKVSYNA